MLPVTKYYILWVTKGISPRVFPGCAWGTQVYVMPPSIQKQPSTQGNSKPGTSLSMLVGIRSRWLLPQSLQTLPLDHGIPDPPLITISLGTMLEAAKMWLKSTEINYLSSLHLTTFPSNFKKYTLFFMCCVKTHIPMYTVKTRGGHWCPALALLLYSFETKSFSESRVRLALSKPQLVSWLALLYVGAQDLNSGLST